MDGENEVSLSILSAITKENRQKNDVGDFKYPIDVGHY
jgi:hypothetical protein